MKRLLAMLLCLAMLMSFVPATLFTASAENVNPEDGDISIPILPDDEVDETTEAPAPDTSNPESSEPEVTGRVAYCAACGAEVTWTPVAGRINSNDGAHFYLTENFTYVNALPVVSVEAGATVCVDLNGNDLTTATELNVKGILNIQGEGNVGGNIGAGAFGNGGREDVDFDDLINAGQGNTATYDAALINIASADAVVNIYGGTYSVANDKPIVVAAGKLNVLGGEIAGTVNAGDLTLGGAAKVTLIETANLTVKADWTGSAVIAPAVLGGVAEGDFTGNLTTTEGEKVVNVNGVLAVEVPVVLTGITVTAPTKVEYELGEELDQAGMIVTGVYSDETTAVIAEGFTVTGFESETAGVKTITVTYGEFTATFEVTVKEAPVVLTGITVTPPSKVEYELGEELNLEGLVVTGTYSDETTGPIAEGYTVTGFDSETAGVKTITVTYGDFTATFEVTVKEAPAVITGIEVTTMPTTVSYYVGDAFNSKGMVISAVYSDGSKVAITDYTVTADLTVAGTQTVTITSGEFTATFTVEVKPAVEIEITATNAAKNITVSWTAVDASSYVLYERHLVDGVMTEWAKLTTVTSNKYTHTTVTEGVTYEYKVEAKSGSKVIGEAVSEPITRLVAFNITSVVNTVEGALITWDAFANAEAYNVYRADYVDGAYTEFALIAEITEWDEAATEITYTDLTTTATMKYRYMVRVVCNGAMSPAATGTDFLRLLATTVTVSNTKSGQKLQWTNSGVSGGAYYIWESYQNSDGTWTEETRYKIANNPYTFGGRVNGRMYRYRIAYYNGTFVAPSSEAVEMMYLSTVYPVAVNERNAIKLTWDANKVADKYYLYKSWKVDGVWTEYGRAIATLTELSYTDTDVQNGVEYRYALRPALDYNGVQYISGYRDGTIITRVDGQNFTVSNASSGFNVLYQENNKASRYYIYIFPVLDNGSLGDATRVSLVPANYPNKYNLLASNYGLEPGKAYCIKVVSLIGTTVGVGTTSAPIVYIPSTAYTNVTATTTKMTVTWKKVAGAALFEVNRRVVDPETGATSDWEVVGTTSNDVNSFVDTTAEKGVTYQYIVYGVNGTSYSLGKESSNIALKN